MSKTKQIDRERERKITRGKGRRLYVTFSMLSSKSVVKGQFGKLTEIKKR